MILAGACTALAGLVTGALSATTLLTTLITGISVGAVIETTTDHKQYQVTSISGLTLTLSPALSSNYTTQPICLLDMLPDGIFLGFHGPYLLADQGT